MDQLANNLSLLLKERFNAYLVHFSFNQTYQPVYIMGYNNPLPPTQSREFTIEFTVEEAEESFKTGTAHTWYGALRSNFVDNLLEDSGKLMSMRVDRDNYNSSYKSTVILVVYNLDRFEHNVKNFAWNDYSKEFDKLMEDQLSK